MSTSEVPYSTAELNDQRHALVREIPAWLVANDPHNPSRRRAAVREVRRITQDGYVSDDLDDDVEWIMTNDLGRRLPIVIHLDMAIRRELIELAADVASVGAGVNPADAQFIELLGAGLGIEADMAEALLLSAVQSAALRAA
jgi:hypothetical protein